MIRVVAAAAVLALLGCKDIGDAGARDKTTDGATQGVGVETGSETARYTDTLPRFDPSAREGWPELLVEWAERAKREFDAPTLTANGAAKLSDEVVFVDVRETREISVSRISRSMPLSSDRARDEFVRKAAGKTVVVYCTVGWRSAEYAKRLADEGIDAYNIDGGLCGWAASGELIVNSLGLNTTEIHAYNSDFAGAVPDGYEPVIRP